MPIKEKRHIMKITVSEKNILDLDVNILVAKFYKNPDLSKCELNKALDGQISDFVFGKEKFEADYGQTYLLPTSGKIKADKVLLVGLGAKEDFNFDKLRITISKTMQKCNLMKNNAKVGIMLWGDFDLGKEAQIIAEDSIIGTYDFDKYKSKKKYNDYRCKKN